MKMKKLSNTATVANMLRTKPGLKADDIVKKLKVSKVYAYNLLTQARKKMIDDLPVVEDTVTNENARLSTERVNALIQGRKRLIAAEEFAQAQHADNVNHPAHYKTGGIETIDFIEAKGLNYHLGNVVKYITRADTKGNRKEDLLKAQWYLNREIGKA
jgi:hypothetical protein